jgi:hypothetical protein
VKASSPWTQGAGDRHLGRELGAVGPHCRHLEPPVEDVRLAGGEVAGEEAELRAGADRARDVAQARAAEFAASEARQRVVFEAALDAVVSIDDRAPAARDWLSPSRTAARAPTAAGGPAPADPDRRR